MLHIVFEDANIEALRKSFELDSSLQGEMISIQDDYAVGPLLNIYSEEGIENRRQWWRDVLKDGHYDGIVDDGHVDDNKKVAQLKAKLSEDPEELIWIWAAQNKHDVSGYYWLMSQLKDFQGRIFILYLNNLPFINEKGNIFYPTSLFQIQPKEFVKAKKLARPITLSEFEIDPDEWAKICREGKGVRLLEGGKKLIQKGYNYYDNELLNFIGKDWQKVSKLFQQYFGKVKDTTGDAFLLWRIRLMIEGGKVEMQGNMQNMKEFEVRLAGVANVEAEVAEAQTA
ncbi:DUF1835 domain-containing protein [Segetibacter koreensis]|uniref:DUF1835 domain-containing protein n=1 Tax=Segetibacter koreensis TaxID=398037 RepID=UPI00037169A6|nr:DUF1835 domain-containing protein [Segetibacter koreensis]